jgi:hypothetical protein
VPCGGITSGPQAFFTLDKISTSRDSGTHTKQNKINKSICNAALPSGAKWWNYILYTNILFSSKSRLLRDSGTQKTKSVFLPSGVK